FRFALQQVQHDRDRGRGRTKQKQRGKEGQHVLRGAGCRVQGAGCTRCTRCTGAPCTKCTLHPCTFAPCTTECRHSAFDLVDRYDNNASSSGCFVLIN